MSDNELDISMELDTDLLWEGEAEAEEDPVPLPEDQLQSLVRGGEELFTPSQLVGMVDCPSPVDPCLLPPRSAEMDTILQPSGFQ